MDIQPNREHYALLRRQYADFVDTAELMCMTIESIADGDVHTIQRLYKMCRGIRRHNTVVPPILTALRGQDADADSDDD